MRPSSVHESPQPWPRLYTTAPRFWRPISTGAYLDIKAAKTFEARERHAFDKLEWLPRRLSLVLQIAASPTDKSTMSISWRLGRSMAG
jgi:hypothetical protein